LSGLAAMVWLAWSRGLLAWKVPSMRPARIMVAALAAWLVVKTVFVQVVTAERVAQRHTRDKASLLAALVPLDRILYLFKVKDEGIMFYFGRPVARLAGPDALPSTGESLFCILTEDEWGRWDNSRPTQIVERMCDAQGDGLVLVRLD
jgi:hypothetical protein